MKQNVQSISELLNKKIVEKKFLKRILSRFDKNQKIVLASSNQVRDLLFKKIKEEGYDVIGCLVPDSFAHKEDRITLKSLSLLVESQVEPVLILFVDVAPFFVNNNNEYFGGSAFSHFVHEVENEVENTALDVKIDYHAFSSEFSKELASYFPQIVRDTYPQVKHSLVILSGLNNRETFENMLSSLIDSIDDFSDLEFIVVANGSTDGTSESALRIVGARAPVKVILLPENQGIAGGFNEGLNAAKGDYITFLQDDILIKEKNVHLKNSKFLEMHAHVGLIGGYSGAVCFKNPSYDLDTWGERPYCMVSARKIYGDNINYNESAVEVDAVTCHVMTYRKSVGASFDMLFNPNGLEDLDFSFDVKRKGFRVFLRKVEILNKREEGATRKARSNPLISRVFHFRYFYQKNSELMQGVDIWDHLLVGQESYSKLLPIFDKLKCILPIRDDK